MSLFGAATPTDKPSDRLAAAEAHLGEMSKQFLKSTDPKKQADWLIAHHKSVGTLTAKVNELEKEVGTLENEINQKAEEMQVTFTAEKTAADDVAPAENEEPTA